MAKTVKEIANFELFSVLPGDAADKVLHLLTALGISSAPVISRAGQLLGIVSWRDLVTSADDGPVSERMSTSVTTVQAEAEISKAAELLAESGHRHVAVLEGDVVVGYLSVLDVLRGLLGRPVAHPSAFPHYDRAVGLTWTDEMELDFGEIKKAPDGPGVFVLIQGGARRPNRVLWAEASQNVRTRLTDILALPQAPTLPVEHWLDLGPVFFKAAAIPEGGTHVDEALDALQRSASGSANSAQG